MYEKSFNNGTTKKKKNNFEFHPRFAGFYDNLRKVKVVRTSENHKKINIYPHGYQIHTKTQI